MRFGGIWIQIQSSLQLFLGPWPVPVEEELYEPQLRMGLGQGVIQRKRFEGCC